MKIMRTATWLIRALLFLILLLFAIRNSDPVQLRFYFDQVWQAPLVLVMLACFATGAAFGVLACLPRLFAQRRALSSARRDAAGRERIPQVPPGGMGA